MGSANRGPALGSRALLSFRLVAPFLPDGVRFLAFFFFYLFLSGSFEVRVGVVNEHAEKDGSLRGCYVIDSVGVSTSCDVFAAIDPPCFVYLLFSCRLLAAVVQTLFYCSTALFICIISYGIWLCHIFILLPAFIFFFLQIL